MNNIYKNWWVHNLLAHPVMQLMQLLNVKLAKRVHDETLPEMRK